MNSHCLVDDKLLRKIKSSDKPETIIDFTIWKKWQKALIHDHFFKLKIIDIARSNWMVWPINKDNEAFADFLNIDFSEVKNSIGFEAKKTLFVLIAERLFEIKSVDEQSDKEISSKHINVDASVITLPVHEMSKLNNIATEVDVRSEITKCIQNSAVKTTQAGSDVLKNSVLRPPIVKGFMDSTLDKDYFENTQNCKQSIHKLNDDHVLKSIIEDFF